jgi:protein TonB
VADDACLSAASAAAFRVAAPLRAAEVTARTHVLLLALVVSLHLTGAALLLQVGSPAVFDEAPSVLQVSWITGDTPASPEPPAATIAPAAAPPPPVPPRARPQRAARPTPPARAERPVPQPRTQVPAPESPVLALAADAPGTENQPATAPEAAPEAPISADSGTGTAEAFPPAASAGTQGGGSGASDYVAPDFNANYLSNPRPDYPHASNRLREHGVVRLRVYVTEGGRPGEVVLYKSSGYARLDKAATDAVWRWQFQPARRAGVAVAAWVVVPIKFNLRS